MCGFRVFSYIGATHSFIITYLKDPLVELLKMFLGHKYIEHLGMETRDRATGLKTIIRAIFISHHLGSFSEPHKKRRKRTMEDK
jgi:hypothetical protein